MENYIVSGILVVIVAAVIVYLVKQKKNGVKCVGCPHAKQCSGKCSSCGGNCTTQKTQ